MLVGEGCRAPTENAKYNIHHCFLLDPDGYQTEIQSFRNLHSNGDIQIDGTVEGDIKSRLVTVGETCPS